MIDKNYILNLLNTDADGDSDNNTDWYNNSNNAKERHLTEIIPSTFLSIGDNSSISSGLRIVNESEINYYLTEDSKDIQPLNNDVGPFHLGIEVNNSGDIDALNVNLEVYFIKKGSSDNKLNVANATLIHSTLIYVKSHNKLKYVFKFPQFLIRFASRRLIIPISGQLIVRIYSWYHNEMVKDVTEFNFSDRLESVLKL